MNTGMGFGLLKGQSCLLLFLIIMLLGIIIYYLDDLVENKKTAYYLGMIIGGAIGNLIDRAFFGYVKDFIAFTFWPAFNAADAAITIGGVCLIIYFLREK